MTVQKKVSALGAGVALLWTSVAQAQGPVDLIGPPAGPSESALECLPIDRAMSLSAARDPNARIAEAERASADADLREARSLFRPQISAFTRAGFGDVGLVDSTLQNQVGLRASQRVFDFGDARFAKRAARFAQEASGYATAQARLDAAQGTGLAVLEALEMSERIIVSRERALYFEKQLASIDALLSQGGATRTERANAASRLAEANAILLELEFQRERASQRVLIDTGLATQLCSSEKQLDFLLQSVGVFPDDASAIASALVQNPTARVFENEIKSQEALLSRQKAGAFPVISVVGISAFSSTGALGDLTQQNRVGVDVSIPLYSGNAASAQVDRARAQRAASAGRLAVHQRDLQLQVSVSFRRIASLRELREQRREVARQSLLRFEAAEAQFGFRAITLPDLIDARIEFEDAKAQAISTEYDFWREHLELLALTGQLSS